MAKWCDRTHGVIAVVPKEQRTIYDTPVIVIPEADWRRLVEMWRQYGNGGILADAEADAIIERTEAANG